MQRNRDDAKRGAQVGRRTGAFHPAILTKARAPRHPADQNENDQRSNGPNAIDQNVNLKPELHHARLVGERRVRGRPPVSSIVEVRGVAAVVLVVEGVVDLHHAIDLELLAELDPLLQPQIDTVERPAQQVVTRDDGTVGPEAVLAASAFLTAVGTGCGRKPHSGTVEVDPAQLVAVAEVHDAVDVGAVPLIVGRVAVLASEILASGKSSVRRATIPSAPSTTDRASGWHP
mgnify:CR=1 FL=1